MSITMISRILQKMGQNGVCGGIGISHGVVVICQLDLLDLLDILDLSVFQSLWENTAQRRDADGTSFPQAGRMRNLLGEDAAVTMAWLSPSAA